MKVYDIKVEWSWWPWRVRIKALITDPLWGLNEPEWEWVSLSQIRFSLTEMHAENKRLTDRLVEVTKALQAQQTPKYATGGFIRPGSPIPVVTVEVGETRGQVSEAMAKTLEEVARGPLLRDRGNDH